MTDYDREYQKNASACGEPFAEFVEFFRSQPAGLSVLDLGCGQGRDALVAGRHGHSVHGIDIAGSGVAQLVERAEAEGLQVLCDKQDIEEVSLKRLYDVVVLDRVMHMLPSEERRRAMLRRAQSWVAAGGHMLLADTKSNRELIRGGFAGSGWEPVLDKRDFFFVRRSVDEDK